MAILSWFVYPGVGQAALGRKARAQLWALVFTVCLGFALYPLVNALSAFYGAVTSLGDIPGDMASRLLPTLEFGAGAAIVWLACGIDAWRLAGQAGVGGDESA
jgi:hypothetical protein